MKRRIIAAVLYGALAAAFAWAFHERYWRWRDCFNELDRCYDPEQGVMLAQAGPIWGGLALLCALLALRALLRRR